MALRMLPRGYELLPECHVKRQIATGKEWCIYQTSMKTYALVASSSAVSAWQQEGCLGARMTGAGFGGCAIALVQKDKIEPFIENVQKTYTQKIGYPAGFFACGSGDGVHEVDFSNLPDFASRR